ncbi:MAG: hypothetical protein WC966_03955 [Bradymonadales bacterium]|jgi:predicted metalloprotease with PDZ domain
MKVLRFAVTLCFCLLLAYEAKAESGKEFTAHYTLFVQPQEGKIEAKAEFLQLPKGAVLCLPAMGQREGENFLILELLRDEQAVVVAIDPAGCFVNTEAAKQFVLRYELGISKNKTTNAWLASSLSPHRRAGSMYFPSESLFVDLPSAPDFPITLQVEGLASDALASTIKFSENRAFTHFNALKSSYFVFNARFKEERFKLHDTELRLIMDSNLKLPIALLEEKLARMLELYRIWAPNRIAKSVSMLAIEAAPKSKTIAGFARTDALVLQLGRELRTLDFSVLYFLAHEIFHLYNGENLRFVAHKHEESAWFTEGMTNYIALQALLGAELITPAQFLEQAHKHAQLSENAQSLVPRPKHWPYNIGFMMSLAIDAHLREASASRYNLRGFWRYLAASKYWELGHTNASIAQALFEYSGLDYSQFIQNYGVLEQVLPLDAITASFEAATGYYR